MKTEDELDLSLFTFLTGFGLMIVASLIYIHAERSAYKETLDRCNLIMNNVSNLNKKIEAYSTQVTMTQATQREMHEFCEMLKRRQALHKKKIIELNNKLAEKSVQIDIVSGLEKPQQASIQ